MAQQVLVTQDSLAAFFGTFNAWVGALCVATQLLLTAGILRRFGLGPVLFLLPVGLLFGSGGLLGSGTLVAAVLLKGATRSCATRSTGPRWSCCTCPCHPA